MTERYNYNPYHPDTEPGLDDTQEIDVAANTHMLEMDRSMEDTQEFTPFDPDATQPMVPVRDSLDSEPVKHSPYLNTADTQEFEVVMPRKPNNFEQLGAIELENAVVAEPYDYGAIQDRARELAKQERVIERFSGGFFPDMYLELLNEVCILIGGLDLEDLVQVLTESEEDLRSTFYQWEELTAAEMAILLDFRLHGIFIIAKGYTLYLPTNLNID